MLRSLICKIAGEAIHDSDKEIYRMYMHPSFRSDTLMRIEINGDGTSEVVLKIGDRFLYPPDNTISAETTFTKAETDAFLELIRTADFWNLPEEKNVLGLDGHDFVIEGVKDGVYHAVERWCPGGSDPVGRIEIYYNDMFAKYLNPDDYRKKRAENRRDDV